MKQMNNFPWACSVIRDAIESKKWGTVTFNFKDGTIISYDEKSSHLPPIDKEDHKP